MKQQKVADCVQQFGPDYTIHLGDVYFVGDRDGNKREFSGRANESLSACEVADRQARKLCAERATMRCTRAATVISTRILPRMGLRKSGAEWGDGQWASFFCLENKYWRILGLDTGYNATALRLGQDADLGKEQTASHIRLGLSRGAHYPKHFVRGCESTVNPDADKRGLVLLTHHGCYSAFSDWYQIPAKQLAGVIHRPVIWFWGHEHKLAIYDRYHVKAGDRGIWPLHRTRRNAGRSAGICPISSVPGSSGTIAATTMARTSMWVLTDT